MPNQSLNRTAGEAPRPVSSDVRNDKMKDTINQFWNSKDAESFDSRCRRSGRMAAITRIAEMAEPYLTQASAISIDLGCGTGLFAEAVRDRNIIGVDFSSSFLALARKRMDTVWQQDIFDLQLKDASTDNIVSLFVIDDYPSERKRLFFAQVFWFLKPDGRFFFSAYSPNDENMGKSREETNLPFELYIEKASFYEKALKDCGFAIDKMEIIKADGVAGTEPKARKVKREFIVIAAHKPLYIEGKHCEQLDAPDRHYAALHGGR